LVALFIWANSESKICPDPHETSQLRILAVTWNLMGQKPNEDEFV